MTIHRPHPWHKLRRIEGHPDSSSSDADGKKEDVSDSVDDDGYQDAAEWEDGSPAIVNEENFKTRFGLDSAEGWDHTLYGLKHMWRILQTLPVNHVRHSMLERFKRVETTTGGGGYTAEEKQIDIHYDDMMRHTRPMGNKAEKGDALYGVDGLDSTVKHEVGHSLDAFREYSGRFNPAGWQDHSNEEIVDLFVERHALGDAAYKDNIKTLLKIVSRDQEFLPDRESDLASELNDILGKALDGTPPFDGVDQNQLEGALAQLGLREEDGRQDALGELIGNQGALFEAYYDAYEEVYTARYAGSHENLCIDDRFYQLCADGQWRSYDAADRQKKVSNYQYATPKEWFAEHYAAYYGSAQTRQWLEDKDPYVHQFFSQYVDPANPLPETMNGTNTRRPQN